VYQGVKARLLLVRKSGSRKREGRIRTWKEKSNMCEDGKKSKEESRQPDSQTPDLRYGDEKQGKKLEAWRLNTSSKAATKNI